MQIFRKKQNSGFTLIELLVVVAIIGMLSSVMMLALGMQRMKARDAKRLSDARQIKTGLDLYYTAGNGYPDNAQWDASQSAHNVLVCSGIDTFRVPNDITPGFTYDYTAGGNSYTGCGAGTVWSTYKVQFQTEGETALGPAGTYYVSPLGITTCDPFLNC